MPKIDKELLENGKALQAMVNRFCEEQSKERMLQLLDCLTDCQVVIPCNARITKDNQKILEESKVGNTIQLADELGFTPDNLITPDGHRFIPIFSNEERADSEYLKHFSRLKIYISDFLPLYDNIKGEAKGLLLDYSIGIKDELIEIMKKMCEDKSKQK